MSQVQEIYEEGMAWQDYLAIVIKRKVVVLSLLSITIFAGILAGFLLPKIYESSAIVQVGSFKDPLMGKVEAVQIIQSQRILSAVSAKLNGQVSVNDLKKRIQGRAIKVDDIKETTLLRISTRDKDRDLAARICQNLATEFVGTSKELYAKRANLLSEQIESYKSRAGYNDQQVKRVNNEILSEQLRPDFPLLQNTVTSFEGIYSNLLEKYYSGRELLINSKDFEVFEAPEVPINPISPNRRLLAMMSAIIGLLLGISVALFQESFNLKRRVS
jgi:uncharacterized protein involved in exopolysaccharide biosynthesis